MEWEIRVLGPVQLRGAGHVDALGSAKERLLLAALAYNVGRPVSLDTLVHRLWDDAPPGRPGASLHAYVARIRRRLRLIGAGERLVQQAHTYTLELDADRVDCHRFQSLTAQARSLSDGGNDTEALRLLAEAEELWRGEPLAGLPGQWAEHIRGLLTERRLPTQLIRTAAELRNGHFADLVPDLTALLAERPTDELVAGRLMTASYGCGRQADALRVYDSVRRRLREDLGADPGEELARLQRLILDGAPVQALLPRAESAVSAPQTLPGHGELVGREEELATILRNATAGSAASVIALQSVSGMAGVGKTLIALHAARRLAPHFPDGAVHLDLGTHAFESSPLTPEAALTALIRAFGVPASALPHDREGLVGLWRSLLANRRAVVVLDDVAGPEQLRPLLPGASRSLIIVTSRRRLTGLPGIRSIQLDVLPPRDAIALFRTVAGEERTHRHNEVADIVRLAGHLPLAVELAAGRLASRPSWTTAHLLRRLTHGQGRLKEIRDGTRGEIGRAFDVSYRTLKIEEQTVFRFLGLRFGADIDVYGVAALAGLPVTAAEDALEGLLDAHLIREPAPERFALHDLLGEYARALTLSEDPKPARDRAVARLIDFYVQASDAADRMIYPRRLRLDRPLTSSPYQLPSWEDPLTARRWLAAECSALLAAERHCRAGGRAEPAALLASALAAFLDDEGHSADAQRVHAGAVEYWQGTGARHRAVHASIDLGNSLSQGGRYEEAHTALRRALVDARELGAAEAEAEALHRLGVLHWNLGRLSEALEFQRETLRKRLLSGDPWQLGRARNNLGITNLYLGNFEESRQYFDTALTDFQSAGDRREYAHVLNNLSDLFLRTGDPQRARHLLENALEVLRETGVPSERAITQVNLASTMKSPDDLTLMLDLFNDSLATFRRSGDRRNASETLHAMGKALYTAGHFGEATTRQQHALDLARSVGAAHEEGQALHALGLAEHRLGRHASAVAHLTEAVEVADRVGAAHEAARARESLLSVQAAYQTEDSPNSPSREKASRFA
ncbi:DNA-binding SARP family transcriptional activator/tetratricopeptide (TPR) repeat protein [Streptomyces sp. SAI-144]|uniref:AfsR/SARP family transcriptional regulator n=1 Tax=unclassified Streptomyces TaxID=2593676 RepID=UPI0024752AB1|nr:MULTISPECIES: BTAD domain-containing putative transcriptional regulator [unclassified Streptomyces]MDH6438603.1 DNA-binding SARP family transcriptional activator/tetratricopeptide (TPR) repeat protein [Streptomyces sp. SAI-144]MDH6486002.1 DNA-binding SARP family transcriptional activator/tetratricopeptide (TPR) repeat protein [Streptomyces sp. SAI-127]